MRIYVVVEQSGIWYPQNAMAMLKATGKFKFVDDPKDAEVIWVFSYYQPLDMLVSNKFMYQLFVLCEKLGIPLVPPLKLRRDLKQKLVVASFHHLYRPKEITYIHRVRLWDSQAQVIQFFSHKNITENADYFTKPVLFAPYWLDLQRFLPYSPSEKQAVRAKYGVPLDKKIIGSFQRDTDRDGSPKLEKGPDVLCDALEPLAGSNFFVLLAGPRRSYVENRLSKAGIPFKNVGTVRFEDMNALYQSVDYYLVTSRCEGGPQAILECMAGKIPVLSTDVGIAGLLDPRVMCAKPGEFTDILRLDAYPDVLDEHYKRAQLFDAYRIADDYHKKFSDLYQAFMDQSPKQLDQICVESRKSNQAQDFVNSATNEVLKK